MTSPRHALSALLFASFTVLVSCSRPSPDLDTRTDGSAAAQALPLPSAPPVRPAPDAASVNVSADVQAPVLAIDGEGLRLFARESGSARPIAFGTSREQTLAGVAYLGTPILGVQNECGAGPLDFATLPSGLKLYFQGDKFAGWAVSGARKGTVSTAAGIGIGSSRSDLVGAYAASFTRTSLGNEFAAGDVYGLLDGPGPTARISDLWAGANCNFR